VLLSGSILFLIPCLFLLIECLFSLAGRSSLPTAQGPLPNLAVLVPAHNEAMGIDQTLATIMPQLPENGQIIVIADNCTDTTAAVARQAGAKVIERHNPQLRGKGYALDFGIQHLANHPPEVVVFVDADCNLLPGSLHALAQQTQIRQRPCQAVYLMEKPQQPSTKDGISALAFRVKNLVRPLGLWRLGQPCLLTGTGIALPWSSISQVDLASGHIVEDMKLGLDLALAGYAPQLCPPAQVLSRLPEGEQAATTQRTRWEHGHLKVMLEYAPKLFGQTLAQRRLDLLALGLEISILPISLLVIVALTMLGITGLGSWLTQNWLPFQTTAIATAAIGSAISLAWLRFGRADLSLKQLVSIPFYLLWKIPLYLQFLVKPQQDWVRTERD
jgi:cellulose synthase/poly-beta-1,6-N-acetylglucosamine synthase-like glycosyltransferase